MNLMRPLPRTAMVVIAPSSLDACDEALKHEGEKNEIVEGAKSAASDLGEAVKKTRH